METPDPPSDPPGASKQVVLTPHDIPRSLRVVDICFFSIQELLTNFDPGVAECAAGAGQEVWEAMIYKKYAKLGG